MSSELAAPPPVLPLKFPIFRHTDSAIPIGSIFRSHQLQRGHALGNRDLKKIPSFILHNNICQM